MADREPYATPEDFARFGLRTGALEDVTTDDLRAHLRAASDHVDGKWLGPIGGYVTPLRTWGDDLRRAVCQIAALSLLSGQRGFDPEGRDKLYVDNAAAADDHVMYLAALGAPTLVSGP